MTRKGQISRERIIETANRLIYTKGFNQTSFADVAETVGITKGNLHYHFRSKDELLQAIVEYRLLTIRYNLTEWTNQYADARQRLQRFVNMLLDEESQLIRYGCPMGSLNVELGKTQPALHELARQMFDLFREWLAMTFKQLGHRDHRRLAMHLLSMAQGAVQMSYVYRDAKLLRDECRAIHAWLDSL